MQRRMLLLEMPHEVRQRRAIELIGVIVVRRETGKE
jgi:hypothetical protein